MSLPASVKQVPVVSGYVYRDATGSVPEGARVVFTARTKSVVVDDATVTLPAKLVALVTAAGALPDGFTLQTAGADGVYYDVIEDFSGGRDKFTILVLPTDTEVNLATLAPAAPPADPDAETAQAAAVSAAASASTATTQATEATASATAAAASAAEVNSRADWITVEAYGTVGAGANDNALFTAAVAAAKLAGKRIVANGLLYKLDGLVLTDSAKIEFGPNTEIRNVQASGTKLKSLTFRGALQGSATAITAMDNLTTSATSQTSIPLGNLCKTFTVASTAGLAVGDTIRVFEDNGLTTETRYGTGSPLTQDFNYREFATIAAIVGSKITTEEFLRWPYDTAKSLKCQKVAFVDRPAVVGGKWTSGNAGGGGIGFEFCRRFYCDRIQGTGNSDADRAGGSPVTVTDCWEGHRGSVHAQWTLYVEDTARNQSCTFGRIGGKRTTSGGSIHSGDILCNFAEMVQDSPGDTNGDGLGISNGFRANTIESVITSGSNCYGLWLHQSCDDNTFTSLTNINGITGAIQCYGNRNVFRSVKVRGNSSYGIMLAGDDNQANVDIEVLQQAVHLQTGSSGNRVTGRAVSLGSVSTARDLLVATGVKNSYVDITGGARGVAFTEENHSNDFHIRGKNSYRLGRTKAGRGWSWSRVFSQPAGSALTLQVPGYNSDGSDATNGLVDVTAPAADPPDVYRITLSFASALADTRSEYEVMARAGVFTIRTIYEGTANANFTPKLRTAATNTKLEIYTGDAGVHSIIVRIDKH